jgi:choline dehydrogenase-like flavoprotein
VKLPADLERREWDAIVIGTGMGGATLGYVLAKAGKRVLFCEKGCSSLANDALRGDYAERFFPGLEAPQPKHRDLLARAGRYAEEIIDMSSGYPRRFIPFIGSGTGGSTALYGMLLDRFHAADFAPRRYYPDAKDSTVPEYWPITYEELLPYYQQAEQLYGVQQNKEGEGCPAALHPANQELFDFLAAQGLHPRGLPKVTKGVQGCLGCQGYLCARACKHDAAHVCLRPALEQYGSELLDMCEVIRLEATRTKVTAVQCRHRGQELTLRTNAVVLAAGALETPRLLLNSASDHWPNGLANDSGFVGRNLMRHFFDLHAISTRARPHPGADIKELAFDDWYAADGGKFGTVQSFGAMPPVPLLIADLEQRVRASRMSWLVPLLTLARPALCAGLDLLLSSRVVLASIMEDLPYADNRVMLPVSPAQGRLLLHYRIHPHEVERIRTFRQHLRELLKPYRVWHLKDAENNERLAHVCGTCRFGHDPNDSVLDATNRAHGLANLYVVDSSFFPSSGGTNPSLTIAANALRVGEHLTTAMR